MRFLLCFTCFLSLFLNACTTMNSKFTCKTPDGVICSSLDEVNGMVDRGVIGGKKTLNKNISFALTVFPGFKAGDKLRYGESVMRIWVAPYEDLQGNYHAASVFYMVVKPGHWLGLPSREVMAVD